MVIIMVVREALANGIPLTLAVRLIPFILPDQFRFTLPMTLLLATTTFFAKMSSANEITALKSLGVAPWKILWPVYLFAIMISLLTVWLNDLAVTWAKPAMTRVLVAGAEEYILSNLRNNHQLAPEGSGFSIMVKGVENKRLINPTIRVSNPPATISALWAELAFDPGKETLTFILYNLAGDAGENVQISANRYEETLSLGTLMPGSQASDRPSDLSMDALPVAVNHQLEQRTAAQNKMAANATFAVCVGDYQEFSTSSWNEFAEQERQIREKLNKLYLEPPRRWSSGFSCFFFVWIGAPLAIWLKKTDVFASFFACFIPILILYYPLLMFGLDATKNGVVPPDFIWSGNIFLGLIGFWFLKKVHRY